MFSGSQGSELAALSAFGHSRASAASGAPASGAGTAASTAGASDPPQAAVRTKASHARMRRPVYTPGVRVPHHRYEDPLDRVWRGAAARVGFRVARTPDVYASTDGKGTILVGTPDTLDADDSLAQMIFHEMCHALVEGPGAIEKLDWGLDNQSERDRDREHACLRLQAALSAPYGLRRFFAPTTDYREFWDALPDEPFVPGREASSVAARRGLDWSRRKPWAPHLAEALAATAAIVREASRWPAPADGMQPLYDVLEPPSEPHPGGFRARPGTRAASETCATCAWHRKGRCLATRARVADATPACSTWEPPAGVDCQTCGACCREAYHSVTIPPRSALVRLHPSLIVHQGSYIEIRRDGDRCAALGGGHTPDEPYACAVYDDRPKPCRDFERLGANCLEARRRVGLSS